MSRTEQFWGSNSLEAAFPGGVATSPTPWPQAGQSTTHRYYNPRLVDEALSNRDANRRSVDPRGLLATQPDITRAGVDHYMKGDGSLYADSHQAGNQDPVVFHDQMRNREVLLSGHHRATTALLQGRQFETVYVSGQPSTHAEARDYQRETLSRQREERMAKANAEMNARIGKK